MPTAPLRYRAGYYHRQDFPPDDARPRDLDEGERIYLQVHFSYAKGRVEGGDEVRYYKFTYHRDAPVIECEAASYHDLPRPRR
jgi:hypothetical protein